MTLNLADFDKFFEEVTGRPPLPWQRNLAKSWSTGALATTSVWADLIGIPTGLGKTAGTIIAWLFALATALESDGVATGVPRRFFHVVDRRVIVDESYELAKKIVTALEQASGGVCARIRGVLRGSSDSSALACGRMRGGAYNDSEWTRDPTRPAIVSTTVDQLGSALAFRKYMATASAAPIYAGLASCDAVILLDEAHISLPFMRMLERVKESHAQPLRPLVLVRMTATPEETPTVDLTGADLLNEVVRRRTTTAKPARIFRAASPDGARTHVHDTVQAWIKEGRTRIAAVRNTVKEARLTHAKLAKSMRGADVILLTGRCRPFDRDQIVSKHQAALATSEARTPLNRPLVVVCTQCIEVGADFDFDSMVTDAAPLDALLQRAGRLGRGGLEECPLVVVASGDDPVYGDVVVAVTTWLEEQSNLDFSWAKISDNVKRLSRDEFAKLLTRRADSPTLTEDVFDLWMQSNPRPANDPSVVPFLHGYGRTADVFVAWRQDLSPDAPDEWASVVGLAPPTAPETVSVPLWEAGKLLAETHGAIDDVDDLVASSEREVRGRRPFLLWRGVSDQSEVSSDVRQIRPGDLLVIPTSYGGHDEWGWSRKSPEVHDIQLAVDRARGRIRVRAHARLFTNEHGEVPSWWKKVQAQIDDGDSRGAFDLLAKHGPEDVRESLASLTTESAGSAALYPNGNGIVFSQTQQARDEDDASSLAPRRVTLNRHLRDVGSVTRRFSAALLGPEHPLTELLARAGEFHDEGKAERLFQHKMRGRGSDANSPVASEDMLAKSQFRTTDNNVTPRRWRHEFASVEISEDTNASKKTTDPELFRYLVGTHHGHGRCFAPPCHVARPTSTARVTLAGDLVDVRSDYRFRHLDSDWVELFLAVNARLGRWNVAYLESLLRLADWSASKREEELDA